MKRVLLFSLFALLAFAANAQTKAQPAPEGMTEGTPPDYILDLADEQYDEIFESLNGSGVSLNRSGGQQYPCCTEWEFNGNYYVDANGVWFMRWERGCYTGPFEGHSDYRYVMMAP